MDFLTSCCVQGTTQAADVTSVLVKDSYWGSCTASGPALCGHCLVFTGVASDNIPYFPSIYNVSGYPAMAAKYGSPYVYSDCQRTLHWVCVLLESELTRLT